MRMVGRMSLTSSSCSHSLSMRNSPLSKDMRGCRQKRQTNTNDGPNEISYNQQEIYVRLETPSNLFEAQKHKPTKTKDFQTTFKGPPQEKETNNYTENNPGKSEVILHLVHSPQVVAPNFKLVVRGASNNIISTNQTVAFPSCLYTGTVDGIPNAKVSLSTCGGMKKLVSQML